MVSVNVEMDTVGVRLTFDASDLNDTGIKQTVVKTIKRVKHTLIDASKNCVLNCMAITVIVNPKTRHVTCSIPYIEIRLKTSYVPGVVPLFRVVDDETTTDPEMANKVCSAMNECIRPTSTGTGNRLTKG
tara:strand:+ start:6936 stop:7325 length:390 start_codon:yes stop_codon:yes gene_type:complete